MDLRENLNFLESKLEKQTESSSLPRRKEIKRIVEALLFSSSEPITLEKIKEIINTTYPISKQEVIHLLDELNYDYQHNNNAFCIAHIGGGFALRTIKQMHPYVELLHVNRRGEKLSKASSEVLAIVAYKEPITRAEIEKIRGVDSSGCIHSLLERELVEIVGKLETPGRPSQYGITKRFLRHFGLKDREELSTLFDHSGDKRQS